jgi:PAS domain S-box-containing protein
MVNEPENMHLVYLDRDFNYVRVNEAYAKTCGYKPEEMIGKNHFALYPGEEIEAIFKRVRDTGVSAELHDKPFVFTDQPERGVTYWDWKLKPVKNEAGKVEGLVFLMIETTERKKAEGNLRKSEQRYRSYIEVTGELGWTTNAEGEVVEDMPSWRNFTGQSFDEIKGSGWTKALHPDDLENTSKVWKQAVTQKRRYEIEYRVRRYDGVYRYFMARGVPVFNKDGSLREWVGTCIDITERKKAEETLQEQNAVMSSAPDAIFSTNSSFIIKSWNKAAESIFGWKAEEVIGKASTSIFNIKYPTLNGVSRKQALKKLMNTGFWKGEVIYTKKNGSPIPVSVSLSLIKDKDNSVTGTVAIVHDISKRKRRVKALKESLETAKQRAEELEKLMDIIPVAVSISRDPQCQIVTGNQAANALYETVGKENFSAGLATGVSQNTTRLFFHGDKELKPEELPMQLAAAKNIEIRDSELNVLTPSGKKITILGNAKPLLNNEGKVRGCVAAFIDITERKKAEEALRKSEWIARERAKKLEELQVKLEEKAAEVQEYATRMEELAEQRAMKLRDAERLAAIGATAGMVGHDIRNPLQVIFNELYLARMELNDIPESQGRTMMLQSLNNIEAEVGYINKIIKDLQDYAKSLEVNLVEVDLEKVFQKLLLESDFPDNIETKHCVEEKAREIVSDPTLLERIVTNLVNNAVQAMPDGGKLEIQARQENGDVLITVQDSGVGVPSEHKDKLFTPLFTTKAKGQGFGLPVVKRMTEALGGTVTFQSEEGKGTKFIVRLPTAKK